MTFIDLDSLMTPNNNNEECITTSSASLPPLSMFGHLYRADGSTTASTTPPASSTTPLASVTSEHDPAYKDQVRQHKHTPYTRQPSLSIPIADALPLPGSLIDPEETAQLELKRQQQKQKRWIIIVVVVAVLLLATAAVAGFCGAGNCRGSAVIQRDVPTNPPPVVLTPVPSTTPSRSPLSTRADSIISYINSITLSNQTLRYPSSETPEERALQWLIDDDQVATESNQRSLRQRYALGTLWFQTMSGFTNDTFAKTWTTDVAECDWLNVFCNNANRVNSLFLISVGVRGRIPDDLGLLTDLSVLNVEDNALMGTIPSAIGKVTDLKDLRFHNNALTGTIPPALGSLTELETLALGINEFTGNIPSAFGQLTVLKYLYLWSNALTGTVPSALVSMTDLEDLRLYDNALTGTMPFCSLNQTFVHLLVDCNELDCPCCTSC